MRRFIGTRLVGILNHLIDNYQQGIYDRKLGLIANEQNETLVNVFSQLKKMMFVSAVKKRNEITFLMQADLQKNAANENRLI